MSLMARPPHTPVMLDEVVELLRPASARTIVDCTVGLGGHAEALLGRAPAEAVLIGIDRDATNLRRAKDRLDAMSGPTHSRARMFHADFARLREVLDAAEVEGVDALLADLGVASTHLDDPARGFSFASDGPLDMRMDGASDRPTAADVVNTLPERQLADLLYRNADERRSRRIARAIATAREEGRITRTGQLADIVVRAVGGRRGAKTHPATKTFQALRIAVNDELGELDALLAMLPDVLAPGGRAAIISFHSLEDRRVKMAFSSMKTAELARIITPKPMAPDDEELQSNPRSRSAKLRCVERL